jgi:hypothetical protein|tara:strand:+ start:260 stop:421 length:162 start_codon:yes stop_codon:yes gene_type:complete
VNDVKSKIKTVITHSKDERVLTECIAWLQTCEELKKLGFEYLTLELDEINKYH